MDNKDNKWELAQAVNGIARALRAGGQLEESAHWFLASDGALCGAPADPGLAMGYWSHVGQGHWEPFEERTSPHHVSAMQANAWLHGLHGRAEKK